MKGEIGTEPSSEAVGVLRETALIPGFSLEPHLPLTPSLYSQICGCLEILLPALICLCLLPGKF